MSRVLFCLLILTTFLSASFQEVKIGYIDERYLERISYEELREIIDEVEYEMEMQLGFNIFDYNEEGLPINLLYVEPTQLENEILEQEELQASSLEQINELKEQLQSVKSELDAWEVELESQAALINEEIHHYNEQLKALKTEDLTRELYLEYKEQFDQKKASLKQMQALYQEELQAYNDQNRTYNKEIRSLQQRIDAYNLRGNELERKSQGVVKIKGITYSQERTKVRAYVERGNKRVHKEHSIHMQKIDILGFSSIEELRVIIAHEIGHLIGAKHINVKGALMNPIIQHNQLDGIDLSSEDIQHINENF